MGKKKGKKDTGPPKTMHAAVAQSNLEVMEAMFAADPSTLEEKNGDGWTPLM
jgi:hypothetical protein